MQVPGQCTDLQAFEDPSHVPGQRRPHPSVPPPPPLPLLAPSELGLPKVSIQTASSTLSPTAESILVFLQHATRPPLWSQLLLSHSVFRGLKSNGSGQGCPHHHLLGLKPGQLRPAHREELRCQGAPADGQIRAPELVANPAGLVQLSLMPGPGEGSLKQKEAGPVPPSQVGTKELSVSSGVLRIPLEMG